MAVLLPVAVCSPDCLSVLLSASGDELQWWVSLLPLPSGWIWPKEKRNWYLCIYAPDSFPIKSAGAAGRSGSLHSLSEQLPPRETLSGLVTLPLPKAPD